MLGWVPDAEVVVKDDVDVEALVIVKERLRIVLSKSRIIVVCSSKPASEARRVPGLVT